MAAMESVNWRRTTNYCGHAHAALAVSGSKSWPTVVRVPSLLLCFFATRCFMLSSGSSRLAHAAYMSVRAWPTSPTRLFSLDAFSRTLLFPTVLCSPSTPFFSLPRSHTLSASFLSLGRGRSHSHTLDMTVMKGTLVARVSFLLFAMEMASRHPSRWKRRTRC